MKTILIVDDAQDYASNLREELVRAGYTVVLAFNGKEGVEQAARCRPDLILMDVLMPDFDGAETTIKITEQEGLKDIKIVFLTSVTSGKDAILPVMGRNYPALSKRLYHEKIVAKVREYLGDAV